MIFIQFVIINASDQSADEVIGVEEFARLSGLAASTIRNGGAGTRSVPRARRRPLGWRRGDVVAFLTPAKKETPEQFAARLIEERGRGRRRRN